MATVTENYINTIIAFMTRGAEQAYSKTAKVASGVRTMSQVDKEQLRIMGALTPKRERMLAGYDKNRIIVERLRAQKEKVGKLTADESKQLMASQMAMGKYRNAITGTVSMKRQFGTEFKRVQRMTQAEPKNIRHWSAQQSMLNSAYRKGTIGFKEYRQKIEPVNRQLKQLEGRTGRTILKQFQWAIGWYMIYRVIRKVISAIGSVLRGYGDLANEMARVSTVTRQTGDVTGNVMERLKKEVLDYAATSIRNLKEVAESMYHLGSAGLTAGQQLAGFRHILDLTTGTLGNIREVSRLVAGSFNVFGRQMTFLSSDSERFKYISDLLAYTYSRQQVELSEVASAMTLVGSAASLLNIDYKVLIGTIGELNTGMLRGTRAGTSLMNSFIKIAQNSDKLGKLLGVTFDPDMPLDFVGVMEQLHDRFGDTALTAAGLKDLMQVFGIRGARAVGQIINRFDEWKKTISTSDATFSDFAENMRKQIEDTLPRQLKILGTIIQVELIERVRPWLDDLKTVISYIVDLAKNKELKEFAKKLGRDVGEVGLAYMRWGDEIYEVSEKEKAILKQITDIQKVLKDNEAMLFSHKKLREEEIEALKRALKLLRDELWQTMRTRLAREGIGKAEALAAKKREKALKEEAAATAVVARNIERIIDGRRRGERIAELEKIGLGEHLILEEQILELYYKGLRESKKKREVAGELLGISELLLLNHEGLLDILKSHGKEIDGIKTTEEALMRVLRVQGLTWKEIEEIIGTIAEHDFPLWKKLIIDMKSPIRDMFKTLVAGTEDWGNIFETIINNIGRHLESVIFEALQPKPGEGKGIFGLAVGGLLAGAVGGLFAGLGALIAGVGKDQEKIREATLDVSAGIDISNEQLAIVNRNLLAIRAGFEAYPMPKSFYFRQRYGMGIGTQNVSINMPPGSSGEDAARVAEEFAEASVRGLQPS